MLASVIIAKRLPTTLQHLTYAIPSELENSVRIGQLVSVPFRNKQEFGVIFALNKDNLLSENINIKLIKQINKIVFYHPLITSAQLSFIDDTAAFYNSSLGFLLKTNLFSLNQKNLVAWATNEVKTAPLIAQNNKASKPQVKIIANKKDRISYIQEVLDPTENTFFLVPDKSAAQDVFSNLPETIKQIAATVTGEISNKKLFSLWQEMFQNKIKIIVGTRRAFFLPWTNLQKIILDDEGNQNHKNWDSNPRLHARDAAFFLSHHHKASLIFLTHTPTVETYFFLQNRVYKSCENNNIQSPSKKIDIQPIQNVIIIDQSVEKKRGSNNLISHHLEEQLENESGDIFCYLNKRGNASAAVCRDCGYTERCLQCKNTMIVHNGNLLRCHFCNLIRPMASKCPNCNGINIAYLGSGTQLAENLLQNFYSNNHNTKIIRIDSDTDAYKLDEVNPNQRQVYIGTQLAWQKINWSKIKLMVFLDADGVFYQTEYKSIENFWQALRSAAFKLDPTAKIIIQTIRPNRAIFQSLNNPSIFYEEQLKERKIFNYPPFCFILKFTYSNPTEKTALTESQKFYNSLIRLTKNNSRIKLIGPIENVPLLYANKYIYVILAKISYSQYKKDIRFLTKTMPCGWKIDPNPNTLLTQN